jgi:hypothetical protein
MSNSIKADDILYILLTLSVKTGEFWKTSGTLEVLIYGMVPHSGGVAIVLRGQ